MEVFHFIPSFLNTYYRALKCKLAGIESFNFESNIRLYIFNCQVTR